MSEYTLSSGYQPRFESRWGPWGFSGNISPQNPSPSPQNRCRSPVDVECSTLKTGDVVDGDEEDDDCENDEDEDEDDDDAEEDGKGIKEQEPTAAVDDLEPASRVGVGLTNLGNTCFVNAVLQCLVHTYPLEQGLFMVQDNLLCFLDSFCLICFLKRLIHCSFTLSDEISPINIVTNLKYFSPEFTRFQQEDAHEFLQCLLNKLEGYQMRPNPFSITTSDNLSKQVFGGSLVSRLRCSKCNHVSSTVEDLIDLSLEIDEVNTLEGALDSFTKPEKIENISLTCKRCNEIASVEKQFMVEKAPIVASLHLKRFKSDGTTVEKIRKHVDYPLTLNLHPYTVDHPEHNGGLMYDLYAVIVHLGFSSNRGHYYCFVRSSPSVWHEFDDSTVTRVGESHVLSQEAYILFYSKRDSSWFSNGNEVRSLCPPIISPNSVLDNLNQSGESSSESSRKCDGQVTGQDEGNVATCQTGFSVPHHVSTELIEEKGHGKFPEMLHNDECDDKNEVNVDDSSFNFDRLLNGHEKENRSWVVDINDSSLNSNIFKDDSNNTSKEEVVKRGSLLSCDAEPSIWTCQEQLDYTQALICSTSNTTSAITSAFPTVGEASNLTSDNLISADLCPTKSASSMAASSHSREDTEVEKRVVRKRSANKTFDDQRKMQISKVHRRNDMRKPLFKNHKFRAR